MPSIDDVFNELKDVNKNLQTIEGTLTKTQSILSTGFSDVLNALQTLVTLSTYADQALWQLSKQDETIICELKAIAKQTCQSLNEQHEQTKLLHSISHVTHAVEEMFETVHPAAALERKRLEGIRERVLECCPKEPPPPVCSPTECPAPAPLPPPPQGNPIG